MQAQVAVQAYRGQHLAAGVHRQGPSGACGVASEGGVGSAWLPVSWQPGMAARDFLAGRSGTVAAMELSVTVAFLHTGKSLDGSKEAAGLQTKQPPAIPWHR